jgi:hypothetical protein
MSVVVAILVRIDLVVNSQTTVIRPEGCVLTDVAAAIPEPLPAPLGTMVESEKKNQLSLAYLQMVAAVAGFEVAYWKPDYNGVDATLRSYARYDGQSGAEIDLQLKCTSHQGHQHTDFISYPLERPVFEKLSDAERFQLGALAVLVVPEDAATWLHQDEERLFARGCMYFSPATEWGSIEEGAESKSVRCYRENILTVSGLAGLLQASAAFRLSA